MASGTKGLRPVQKEYIKGSGVAFKDFTESTEKKQGGRNGFLWAEAELMRVKAVINGMDKSLLDQGRIDFIDGVGQ